MKFLISGVASAALGLMSLPFLFAGGGEPIAAGCGTPAGEIAVIAATIRQVESNDNYTARSTGSTASGAYQFIDTTWAGFESYPEAYLAPPEVQDRKAFAYIEAILADHAGDVTAVPVKWYLGHVPEPGSPSWDVVPFPSAGNVLTPRQYQQRWLAVYDIQRTQPAGPSTTVGVDCAPVGDVPALAGGWSLPGPRDLLEADPGRLDAPHHDYPAWDWGIPTGTPIYAIRGGVVAAVTNEGRNCAGVSSCNACGLGVIITDEQNVEWTYCHGSAVHVATGQDVVAGQGILASGNTGNSTGPHLHLGIRVGGERRCPQPLLRALFDQGIGLDPVALPSSGCSY